MNIELLSFFTVSFIIAITPGPSVIYVVSYSLRYGSKAGVIATLGINFGSIIFILIAAFGLSAALEYYPGAITFIQLCGGLYIVYLAVQMWPQDSRMATDDQNLKRQSSRSLFINGAVTSLLNPKDLLFYTAFIPTFIPVAVGHEFYRRYFLMLAFSFMLMGFVTKSAFAIFSGYSKNALRSDLARWLNYLSSIILLVLGVLLVGKSVDHWIN